MLSGHRTCLHGMLVSKKEELRVDQEVDGTNWNHLSRTQYKSMVNRRQKPHFGDSS